MASQLWEERGNALQEWFVLRVLDSVVYVTLVLGYLISILAAKHLAVGNFALSTLVNALYALVAWRIFLGRRTTGWWLLGGLAVLGLLTLASGLLALTGLWFNWLLYFATVGIYFSLLPVCSASAACLLLFIVVSINVSLLNHWDFSDASFWTLLSGFIFVGAFSYSNRLLIIQRERTEHVLRQLEESRHEREEAHAQLQMYIGEVEELTVDRERARMAREIHDTLGHYLTILSIQLETISKLQERDPTRAISEVVEARRVLAQSMQEVRNAVAALRPVSMATLSLPEALIQLTGEFEQAAPEIALTLDLETEMPQLSPDQQLTLYRAAQEALTNVRKHASATKVLLRLRYEEGIAEIMVQDNGRGMDMEKPSSQKSGFGLLGLRERIELLSGQVTYGLTEPVGYRLSARLPVPAQLQSELATSGDMQSM